MNPISRRFYPQLWAKKLVAIRPMTAPVGQVFFLDHAYARTLEERAKEMYPDAGPEELKTIIDMMAVEEK